MVPPYVWPYWPHHLQHVGTPEDSMGVRDFTNVSKKLAEVLWYVVRHSLHPKGPRSNQPAPRDLCPRAAGPTTPGIARWALVIAAGTSALSNAGLARLWVWLAQAQRLLHVIGPLLHPSRAKTSYNGPAN